MSKARPSGQGHRARMRARILRHGAETLADYELLEVLLFYAIPRRDTKPQAKALLAHYGSLGKLLQASEAELRAYDLPDSVRRLLKLPVLAARSLIESRDDTSLQLGSSEALLHYLRGALQRDGEASIGLLCLDSNNSLIQEEMLPAGEGLHRLHGKIARTLLACHATAVIIAYYHPEIPATSLGPEVRGLKQALRALSITVHEAVLLGEGWHISMTEAGLL